MSRSGKPKDPAWKCTVRARTELVATPRSGGAHAYSGQAGRVETPSPLHQPGSLLEPVAPRPEFADPRHESGGKGIDCGVGRTVVGAGFYGAAGRGVFIVMGHASPSVVM